MSNVVDINTRRPRGILVRLFDRVRHGRQAVPLDRYEDWDGKIPSAIVTNATPSAQNAEALQGLYLRAWIRATEEKCGADVTARLMEFGLERLRKRSLSGE